MKSRKRSKLDRIYEQRRRWFLAKVENTTCPVAAAGLIENIFGVICVHHRASTTIHHAWKRGPYILEESTWLGCSLPGHIWIEANKEESRKRGWLADTADTRERWRRMKGGLPLF